VKVTIGAPVQFEPESDAEWIAQELQRIVEKL